MVGYDGHRPRFVGAEGLEEQEIELIAMVGKAFRDMAIDLNSKCEIGSGVLVSAFLSIVLEITAQRIADYPDEAEEIVRTLHQNIDKAIAAYFVREDEVAQ